MKRLSAALVLITCALLAAPSLAAAPPSAAGTQGCLNQWLNDGIWMFRVTSITPLAEKSMASYYGWGVNIQARNATSRDDLMMNSAGYDSLVLWFADGSALDITATTVGTIDAQKLTLHTFPQSSLFKHQLLFWYPAGTNQSEVRKPIKLVLKIDPSIEQKRTGAPQYTSSSPSFIVKLDCSK